jgi:hypothetical protein
VATITWMAGSGLLSFYLANFGHYDATYGSLGAAIALMIWMWMSTIIILFGAELNSEIEHQTLKDSTTGSAKPLGTRSAKMADTSARATPVSFLKPREFYHDGGTERDALMLARIRSSGPIHHAPAWFKATSAFWLALPHRGV